MSFEVRLAMEYLMLGCGEPRSDFTFDSGGSDSDDGCAADVTSGGVSVGVGGWGGGGGGGTVG